MVPSVSQGLRGVFGEAIACCLRLCQERADPVGDNRAESRSRRRTIASFKQVGKKRWCMMAPEYRFGFLSEDRRAVILLRQVTRLSDAISFARFEYPRAPDVLPGVQNFARF